MGLCKYPILPPTFSIAKFDHQDKLMSVSFFHCNITIFPFVMNKYLKGRNYENMQIFWLSPNFYPPIIAYFSPNISYHKYFLSMYMRKWSLRGVYLPAQDAQVQVCHTLNPL